MPRLDQYLLEHAYVDSRAKAQALILAGKVKVNGKLVSKAGHPVKGNPTIEIEQPSPYVSRGGLKLEGALKSFNLTYPNGRTWVALDIGASTGGFTDCLLQKGFTRVHALDVGHGQLDWKLRNDDRVMVYENCNIRQFTDEELGEKVDLIVIDVSFISVLKFAAKLQAFLKPNGQIICLVKPQFEAERAEIGKGGVIRDEAKIKEILQRFIDAAQAQGLCCLNQCPSPIKGAKGNQEWFCQFEVVKKAVD